MSNRYAKDRVCDGEYVFRAGAEGAGFISIVNTTEELIDNVKVELILRDIEYYKDREFTN